MYHLSESRKGENEKDLKGFMRADFLTKFEDSVMPKVESPHKRCRNKVY